MQQVKLRNLFKRRMEYANVREIRVGTWMVFLNLLLLSFMRYALNSIHHCIN